MKTQLAATSEGRRIDLDIAPGQLSVFRGFSTEHGFPKSAPRITPTQEPIPAPRIVSMTLLKTKAGTHKIGPRAKSRPGHTVRIGEGANIIRVPENCMARAVLSDEPETRENRVYYQAVGIDHNRPDDAWRIHNGWMLLGRPSFVHDHLAEPRWFLGMKGPGYQAAYNPDSALPETTWTDADCEVGGHPEDRHELTILGTACYLTDQRDTRGDPLFAQMPVAFTAEASSSARRAKRQVLSHLGPRVMRHAPLIPTSAPFGHKIGRALLRRRQADQLKATEAAHILDHLQATEVWDSAILNPAGTRAERLRALETWMTSNGFEVDGEREHYNITLQQRLHSLAPLTNQELEVASSRHTLSGSAPDHQVSYKPLQSWVVYDNDTGERLHVDIEDFASRNGEAFLDETIPFSVPMDTPEQPEWLEPLTKVGKTLRRRATVPAWLRTSTPEQIAARSKIRLAGAEKATSFKVSAQKTRIHFFFAS